jgi:hypothetical protein
MNTPERATEGGLLHDIQKAAISKGVRDGRDVAEGSVRSTVDLTDPVFRTPSTLPTVPSAGGCFSDVGM